MQKSLSPVVTPALQIEQVVIQFRPNHPPLVTITGKALTTERRAELYTKIKIESMWLPPAGHQFIAEMKAALAAKQQEK